MSVLNYLFRHKQKNSSASQAKERLLQVIVSHPQVPQGGSDYLPRLQRELMEVIAKYVKVDLGQVRVEWGREGSCSILELNITLPDADTQA